MTSTSSFRSPTTTSYKPTDLPHNTHNAALTGALSAAASKPPVKPKPTFSKNGPHGDGGALAAATRAGSVQSSPVHNLPTHTGDFLSRQSTGGSTAVSATNPSPSPWSTRQLQTNRSLSIPPDTTPVRTRSPSNIAATLAAARHTPVAGHTPSKVTERRGSEDGRRAAVLANASATRPTVKRMALREKLPDVPDNIEPTDTSESDSSPERGTDLTSIPSTAALVKIFEQKPMPTTASSFPARVRTPDEPLASNFTKPAILSPKPQRAISLKIPSGAGDRREDLNALKRANTVARAPPVIAPKPKPLTKPFVPKSDREESSSIVDKNVQSDASRVNALSRTFSTRTQRTSSSISAYESAADSLPEPPNPINSKPQLPPPRRTGKGGQLVGEPQNGRLPVVKGRPISSYSVQARSPGSPTVLYATPSNNDMITRPTSVPTSTYKRQNLQSMTAHMTGDSLANAMVGAALAASNNPSRQVSPTRPKPPPPRRSNQNHHFFRRSRTPSPAKQVGKLKSTMRKNESDSSEDDGRPPQRRGIFHRKHPNKHHEGSRKRWRDKVTEHERKRYEGLWAANKGLHLGPNEMHDVSDLVVRDIWRRSRLPGYTLEEVWDLVDRRKSRKLDKVEFVVGTWLIDQRLKGRKLPTKVGESVWASVTGSGTILRDRY